MGAIDEEFEETLRDLREKFRARPDRELEQLLLLALEREQLVTVAYRNDLMSHRLDGLGGLAASLEDRPSVPYAGSRHPTQSHAYARAHRP